LNELRHQVNRLNGEKNLQAGDRDESMRRALAAINAAVQARAAATGPAKPGDKTAVARPHDPFAEIDAEIKNLEATQAVLNSLLDLFLSGPKEPTKERQGTPAPPK
jgi:hypothetical protein